MHVITFVNGFRLLPLNKHIQTFFYWSAAIFRVYEPLKRRNFIFFKFSISSSKIYVKFMYLEYVYLQHNVLICLLTYHCKQIRMINTAFILIVFRFFMVQYPGNCHPKICTKCVDVHRLAYICGLVIENMNVYFISYYDVVLSSDKSLFPSIYHSKLDK